MDLYLTLPPNGNYNFPIEASIGNRDSTTNIRNCIIDPKSSHRNIIMSGLTFENRQALDEYVEQMRRIKSGFVPTHNFPFNGGLIAMKENIGDKLILFSQDKRWEYKNREAVHASPGWSDSVRPVLKAMFQTHSLGQTMGFMFDHTYVNESNGTVTFTRLRDGALENPNQHTEIWNDLMELRRLMQTIQRADFTGPRMVPTDLLIFYDLFPVTPPSSVFTARLLSYIICHAPLFMGPSERYSFASTYNVLREKDKSTFDETVRYDGVRGDVGQWSNIILQSKNDKLKNLYKKCEASTSKCLMPFIRRCYHHMSSREQDISEFEQNDLYLLGLFPGAFSRAYYCVFRIRAGTNFGPTGTFVEQFKLGHPLPLDYSKTNF